MIKTTLLHGILVACGLSGLSLPLMAGLGGFGLNALPALIVVLTLLYIAYLLVASSSRVGKVTLGTVSVVLLMGIYAIGRPPIEIGLIAVSLIWVVRSLLNYSSLVMALLDGLLCALSGVCAIGVAILTGNVWLMIWSFFLLQALFICIPHQLGASPARTAWRPDKDDVQPDRFTRAYRTAEATLRSNAESGPIPL